MTEADWAYLAGLIDGEGSVEISHTVRVKISNTDMGIIGWLQGTFPEVKTNRANSNTSYGHKLCLKVEWNGRNTIEILRKTYPYLQGKKKKLAELALEFLDYVDNSRYLTPERKEARGVLREAAAILNSH